MYVHTGSCFDDLGSQYTRISFHFLISYFFTIVIQKKAAGDSIKLDSLTVVLRPQADKGLVKVTLD